MKTFPMRALLTTSRNGGTVPGLGLQSGLGQVTRPNIRSATHLAGPGRALENKSFGMSRGGIIYQPILFDPGVVSLSPVVPPPGGSGSGGSSGGGAVIAPILAGLLLFLGALGFSPGAVTPGIQGSLTPVPGPANVPAGSTPAQAPGAPMPPIASPPAAPAPPSSPLSGPATQRQPTVPPAAVPSRPTPVVSSSLSHQGPTASVVPGPRRQRPVLPFTGANLLTPMAVGVSLILLGLVLRRVGDLARSRNI